ncbi:NACHT domain-containing protein [Aquirufa aurantiipilula]|uniref:NACHT domain-containing protein n=1 Tax=Aquirufa aurantiipilula TaxID=2696561 RepID=A0ABT6BMU3_9BACT|nr:NACHT domain-containing protein [Aquirufa aurantiipilula]MDF5691762.1 NACHT domain-containing protein [Aquirufa aurantiipilula]
MIETNDTLPVKEILTAAGPFIKAVVDTYVTPKLENLKKRFTLDYNKYHVPTEEHFSEYFYRTYKRVSIINTLVFNNSQRFIKDIYSPLTLIQKTEEKEIKHKIQSFPSELLNKYEKLLITDNAGMGKSTLVKKIFLDTIDEKKGIPLLIELRRLSKEKTIIAEIQEQLNSLAKDFNNSLLLELLTEGGFVIFLDGYDEIPLSDREIVTADLQSFISKATNNTFILTSRPENALKGFGDFQEVKIEPLKKKEAFELLRKYDKQGPVSTLLIKKLEETDMANISEFLTNPLLVSLLFTAFQHKQTIPFKKHIFYRQVYDANFESHDLTKGDSYTHDKYTKLEIDDFHRVLRHIGYSCLKDNQRIEFNKDEILALIRKAKIFCVDLNFNESDFLKDLLSTVPLFTQDGNYFRWAHKSLQEYFAAQFIYLDSKGQQSKILLQLYNNPSLDKFINILDLYYDIDTKTFRSTILFELLQLYKNYYNSTFQDKRYTITQEIISLRKEVCFLIEPFLFTMPNREGRIDHKELDEMIFKLGKNKRISGSLDSPNSDRQLCCLVCSDVKESMCNMLSSKLPNLFHQVPKINREKLVLNISHSLSNLYEPYMLNDKLEDQFNSNKNFDQVTNLIKTSKRRSSNIATNEALKLLEEIEEQINNEKSEDFLLDGI